MPADPFANEDVVSDATELLTDQLVDGLNSGNDESTLVWRKDGSTIVFFDFEDQKILIIEVREAQIKKVLK